VGRVANGKNVIEFSGTAGQVEEAFHTSIRKYVVNGVSHWANSTNPQIPVALSNAVAGVATMHNFGKSPQLIATGQHFEARGGMRPQFTASNGLHALAPADFATIYDVAPLYWGTSTARA
jgi:subtilase family serine protease